MAPTVAVRIRPAAEPAAGGGYSPADLSGVKNHHLEPGDLALFPTPSPSGQKHLIETGRLDPTARPCWWPCLSRWDFEPIRFPGIPPIPATGSCSATALTKVEVLPLAARFEATVRDGWGWRQVLPRGPRSQPERKIFRTS